MSRLYIRGLRYYRKAMSTPRTDKKNRPGKKGAESRAERTIRKNGGTAPPKKKSENMPPSKESNKGKRGSSRTAKKPADKKPMRDKPFDKSFAAKKGFAEKEFGEKPAFKKSLGEKSYGKKSFGDKPYGKRTSEGSGTGERPNRYPSKKTRTGAGQPKKEFYTSNYKDKPADWKPKKYDGLIRLNKFLSNAGIASRRDADQLITLGLVSVNGAVVTEMGHKVDPQKDVVKYDDKNLKPEKLRYVLLNKPKDFITTMDDPEERKTVMWLVKAACTERIYPVGRLDRATTGLLLFTNDGELAKKLTHPKHGYSKLYHVETVEKVKGADLDALREGIKLEDGFIQADEVSFVNDDPRQVGIRIHSGRNRIVRRIFEHFNYTVKKLDRVMFAGLTKKDLARGRYRHLTEQEVSYLKMIN